MERSLSGWLSTPTPLARLSGERWQGRVWIKQEYLRDDELGGNKWCKLLGHLCAAREHGFEHVLSVGGSWSNHLHALALAGRRFGLATTGLVRGGPVDTEMLRDAKAAGMKIEFVSRGDYRLRNDPEQLARLASMYPSTWIIPEGGQGAAGMVGLSALAKEIVGQVEGDVVMAVPVGSGTTFAGLVNALPSRFHVLGFQSFRDEMLMERIHGALSSEGAGATWQLCETSGSRSHRVLPSPLLELMGDFEREEGIPLDPVYTVRMMDAIGQMLERDCLPSHSTIIALHTGGLQGRRGHGLALAA